MTPQSLDVALRAQLLQGLAVDLTGIPPDTDLKALTLHGTTIGAFLIGNGEAAVVFSDGKASMGTEAFSMTMDKIIKVDRRSCLLISGSPSVGERFARALRSWTGYLEDSENRPLPVRGKVNFLQDALASNGPRLAAFGLVLMPIFVTYDEERGKARTFALFPDGTSLEKESTALLGSGYTSGNSLLEELWTPGLSETDGIALARRVLAKTTTKDNASGGQHTVKVLGAAGIRLIGRE